jgi:hypothetical protein
MCPRHRGTYRQLAVRCRREHHHSHAEVAREQPLGGLGAVESRHLQVGQDDVGSQVAGEFYRLLPVGALGDDLDVGLGVQQLTQPEAHVRVVVDDHDANHPHRPSPGRVGRATGLTSGESLSTPMGPSRRRGMTRASTSRDRVARR